MFGYPLEAHNSDVGASNGPYTLWEFLANDRFALFVRLFSAFLIASLLIAMALILFTMVLILCGRRTRFLQWFAIAICLFFGFYASLLFYNGELYDPAYSYPHFLVPSYLAAIILLISYLSRRKVYLENPESLKIGQKKAFALMISLSVMAVASCIVSLILIWPTREIFGNSFRDYSVTPSRMKGPCTLFDYLAEPHYLLAVKVLALLAYVSLLCSLIFAVIVLAKHVKRKDTTLFPWLCFAFNMTFGFLMKWFIVTASTDQIIVGFLYRIPSLCGAGISLFILYLSQRMRQTEAMLKSED